MTKEKSQIPHQNPLEKKPWEQIKDILEEEANELAMVLDDEKTDSRIKDSGFTPRVEIAIRREMNRLRYLATFAELVDIQSEESPC